MDVARFREFPLLGIVRGIPLNAAGALVEAVVDAGLETIEITMNTPEAGSIISKVKCLSKGRLTVGAGTVLSMKDLKEALDAGAGFIVMPVFLPPIVDFCVKNKIPVFPGAFTPQEVFNAWSGGATMVKVFPAGQGGAKYIKELKGPFESMELMAVGGVNISNIKEYFVSGASAVAFGGSVFKKEVIEKGDYAAVREQVRSYVLAVKTALGRR